MLLYCCWWRRCCCKVIGIVLCRYSLRLNYVSVNVTHSFYISSSGSSLFILCVSFRFALHDQFRHFTFLLFLLIHLHRQSVLSSSLPSSSSYFILVFSVASPPPAPYISLTSYLSPSPHTRTHHSASPDRCHPARTTVSGHQLILWRQFVYM